MEIDLGDRKVELIYAGPSHTDGSILVYVPDTRTLFAGDILFTNFHPNMRDGDVKSWISVLDYISTMDAVSIIPGHGPLSGKKDVQEMKQYLMTCDKIGRELSAAGKGCQLYCSRDTQDCSQETVLRNVCGRQCCSQISQSLKWGGKRLRPD